MPKNLILISGMVAVLGLILFSGTGGLVLADNNTSTQPVSSLPLPPVPPAMIAPFSTNISTAADNHTFTNPKVVSSAPTPIYVTASPENTRSDSAGSGNVLIIAGVLLVIVVVCVAAVFVYLQFGKKK